jgi:hypothetical protein
MWQGLLLEDVRLKLLPCQSAIEILEEILNLPEKEKLLSISLLWNWWQERNKGNHGENRHSVDSFIFTVHRVVEDWIYQTVKEKKLNTHNCKWKAPPDEFIKLNMDAAYCEDTRSGGWGVIVRDSKSEIC